MMDSFLPKHEPIELLNVAFANPRILDLNHGKGVSKKPSSKASKPNQQETYNVPDRKTGFVGLHELRSKFPDREWRWVQIDVPYDEVLTHRKTIIDLLGPNYTVMDLVTKHIIFLYHNTSSSWTKLGDYR
ncbi:Asparagine synthetase domain-containing protein [Zancudomyces culisetae]|uniref:Asparagine synthetase domain-containing protein n=1 Tax=Zancudomyces culisetae TaxID=1213189 RepID=A0A1R1PEV8_ZANCU|nr:Asparagine synthetase domain-containing protein [Zancudomyces culisetae]|eukprot:OMH79535.1 Asparagine synthetase domain-containing protein [Zancudomyces culisetae]